jgi:hypothetical protein
MFGYFKIIPFGNDCEPAVVLLNQGKLYEALNNSTDPDRLCGVHEYKKVVRLVNLPLPKDDTAFAMPTKEKMAFPDEGCQSWKSDRDNKGRSLG